MNRYIAPIAVTIAFYVLFEWLHRRKQRRLAMARVVGDRLLGGLPASQTQGMVQKERTLWDAIHEWVLPHSYHPVDINEKRTFIRLDVFVTLSWADRLRLLLCGQMRVLSTVYTDVEVKQCSTLTNIEVHPFKQQQ